MNDTSNPSTEPNFAGEEMKMPAGAPTAAAAPNKGEAFGLILALLFLALVLILGGLYFWYRTTMATPVIIPDPAIRPTAEENNEPESTTAEAQAEAFGVVSGSNELEAISADLESTNLDSLTNELTAIDAEITAEASSATE